VSKTALDEATPGVATGLHARPADEDHLGWLE
jgi:hypothetical protein